MSGGCQYVHNFAPLDWRLRGRQRRCAQPVGDSDYCAQHADSAQARVAALNSKEGPAGGRTSAKLPKGDAWPS